MQLIQPTFSTFVGKTQSPCAFITHIIRITSVKLTSMAHNSTFLIAFFFFLTNPVYLLAYQ